MIGSAFGEDISKQFSSRTFKSKGSRRFDFVMRIESSPDDFRLRWALVKMPVWATFSESRPFGTVDLPPFPNGENVSENASLLIFVRMPASMFMRAIVVSRLVVWIQVLVAISLRKIDMLMSSK